MFNVSLAELLLVLVVMILVIKPAEIPSIIKAYYQFRHKMRKFTQEINQTIKDDLLLPDEQKDYKEISVIQEHAENKQFFSYRNKKYSYDEFGNAREENS